jgi:mRNA interferase MazF
MIKQGGIYLRDFGFVSGSTPSKTRPVVVIQSDGRNVSRLATTIILPLTSNTAYAMHSDNVLIPAKISGLDRDSVVLTYQPATIDKSELGTMLGQLTLDQLQRTIEGVTKAILLPW